MDDFDPDAYIANFDPDQYLAGQSDSEPAPALQSAAFDPDQYIANFDPDKYLVNAGKPEAEGHLAADARELAHGVVPMATGVAAGGALGALAAPTIAGALGAGPVGAVAGFGVGALGMLAGAYVGEKAQDAIVKNVLGYDDDPQRQANREARPIETQVAGLLPFAGSPVASLGQRAAGAGMMGMFSAGQQLAQGEFDPTALAVDTAFGAAMPSGNRVTRAIHGAGESIGEKFAPGRPDTVGPNAAADKADAKVSESPDVAGGTANVQQPAADPKGAIGYENSEAKGPTDGTKKKSTIDEVFGDTGRKGFSQGDVTADPTMQAALGKATLAPETPPPANVGRVVDTGIPTEPAKPQPTVAQVHPDVQAAMDRNAQILREYNGKRQPVEIKKEFERNRQVIFADRNPKVAPTAPLAPEAPVTAPEAPVTAPKKATPSQVQRETGLGYVEAAAEADRRNGVAPVEPPKATLAPEYTPAMQAERLAKIEARQKEPQATLAPEAPASAPRAVVPVEAASDAPIVVEPKVNKRLAREDGAMVEKLREMGWNETADKLEKTPEADRPALRKQIAEALPRDRTNEKAGLKNKLGNEANSPAVRDRQNSAIDAVQKAFDAHPPKENETAQELVDRLKAAVETAHTAHGDNPIHNTKGYRPRTLPNTFNWFRKVQDAALKRKEYWTQDKIDAFKADENATREANAEYPTQDPRLLDASIGKSGRGGNVAERVLETQGSGSHEDAVVDRTNLEKAGRAIKELDQYFRGTRDLEDLSAKARKTLDDMPKDVRKSGFEASEKGADPSHIAKVTDWLRNYYGEPKEPFAAIDTHEQETGFVKPKERPVTSRATLADVEKPATPLLKGVVEKPKTKTKEKKYDFEGKTKSGKELSPEEAARILKASEALQAKEQARAAPKPTFEGGDTDKYSPLKVGIKDMLGHIVDGAKEFGDNERGALDLGKVGADFKALFAKFARSTPPKNGPLDANWEIKPEPTPFYRPIKTEAQAAGSNLAQMINRAGKVDNVITVFGRAAKEQAHILADTKDEQRQMYDAIRKKDPSLITDPKLRDIFEHSIIPQHFENQILRDWLKERGIDVGRDTEDQLHRQSINGGNRELELESIGENADPTAGSSPISTTKRSPVMERQFVALEDADGNRHVVHLKIGETGKPTGEFSVWKDYKNHEMPDNAPPLKFEKVNDLYKIGDRTFKMKDATDEEIHDNALGTDNKPMKYQQDAAASVYTANVYYRKLANHVQLLEDIKNSREFGKYATDKSSIAEKHPDWKKSDVPGFEKYWMDDHIRESLEDAYQQGFADSTLNKIRRFSRAITQSIFWTPVAHLMNVDIHWTVGRGWKWLPNDLYGGRNYRDLAETAQMAIKSVVTFDRIQKILHEEGAGLIYGGTRSENSPNYLAAAVGDAVKKNKGDWEKIADKMGLPVGDLIRGIYKVSRHLMWSGNDMFLTQAILEHLKGHGKNIDTASSDEIRAAIAQVEKHIPNYRTPSRIMLDGENGRTFAKWLRDALTFGFGRYRYGVFNSFAHQIGAVAHGTKEERIEVAGQLAVMGALAFVIYPMALKPLAGLITGNDAAEVRPRGPLAPIGHIKDDLFHRGDLWPLVRETVSLSPLFNSAIDLFVKGKDFGGRDIMNKKDVHDALRADPKAALKAGAQLGGWAVGQRYSPLSTLNSSLGNPNQGVLGGLRDAVLDLKNPSDKSQKFDHQTARRLQQEDNRRRKTQPNLGDKILGGLGIN